MALNADQIRANLTSFAARWGIGDWGERKEAQTFLNELFQCFGMDRREVAEFEHFESGGFWDMVWPRVCLIEMKASKEAERLAQHRVQAMTYWENAANDELDIPSPEYVVLCAFQRFEIWQPGKFPKAPRISFDLAELPDRFEALLFLLGDEPLFDANRAAVTIEAVGKLAELFRSLDERGEGGPDEQHLFVLQCVWSMFAEDLDEIPNQAFTRIVRGLIENPKRSSREDLGGLFRALNERGVAADGLFRGVPYANGRLFERQAALSLNQEELRLLEQAAGTSWARVEPSIFGSLLQGVLGREKQWRLGAHYTHETEIQRIVEPTIIQPWRARIDALETYDQGRKAQRDLLRFVVVDPACGCGNFLYVAYRALRRIERDLREHVVALAEAEGRPQGEALGEFFPITNLRGIEIEAFAVDLARVTLWMGHKLAVRELGLNERTLPLADLSGIRRDDALSCEWPRADAIIGNPPYHGSQNLRKLYEADYLDWLKRRFDCGLKDLCVYWFRRAAEEMKPGVRAGLVGTNSISQNRARGASLNYVIEQGGVITDAVSRLKWPGEAVVNVSIVNWIQKPRPKPTEFMLDNEAVIGINTRLRESKLAVEEYEPLAENAGWAFQGPIPAGSFYLDEEEALRLLGREDADHSKVVRPYLIGDDITEEPRQGPRRWIIDFGFRPLEEAMMFPAALELVRERVKPERDRNSDKGFRENWWRFGRPRGEMRVAIVPVHRFVAGNRIGKRFLYSWQPSTVCPSDLTVVFAFESDYAMGILTSSTHQTWANAESSTLEDRPRYTPTSCFETFAWPQPTQAQHDEVADLARRLLDRRQTICVERHIGLTDFYNQLEDGAWREIADLHAELDRAVARAYGWPANVAGDPLEIRVRLARLHAQIVAGKVEYRPFAELVPDRVREILEHELKPGDRVRIGLRKGGEVKGELSQSNRHGLTVDGPTATESIRSEDVRRIITSHTPDGPE